MSEGNTDPFNHHEEVTLPAAAGSTEETAPEEDRIGSRTETRSETEDASGTDGPAIKERAGNDQSYDFTNRLTLSIDNYASRKTALKNLDNYYIPTGFSHLNSVLNGGLSKGMLIVGAITSLGKSTFLLQIARNVSMTGRPVLYFSYEMPVDKVATKLISMEAFCNDLDQLPASSRPDRSSCIDSSLLLNQDKLRHMSEQEWKKISHAVAQARENCRDLHIIDNAEGARFARIRTNADAGRKDHGQSIFAPAFTDRLLVDYVQAFLMQKYHIDLYHDNIEKKFLDPKNIPPLIIIDYLQIVPPSQTSAADNDKQRIDSVLQTFSRLSSFLPVVIISSYNRGSYQSDTSLSAFKSSGNIEYSADQIITLSFTDAASEGKRSDDWDKKVIAAKNEFPRRITLNIAKNRYGSDSRSIAYRFYTEGNWFEEEGEITAAAKSPASRPAKKDTGKSKKTINAEDLFPYTDADDQHGR